MSLTERVTAILLRPSQEWPVIDGEPADLRTLYGGYLSILALIPAIVGFICAVYIGIETPSGLVTLLIPMAVLSSIFGYALVLVIVYIAAQVADWLAPKFGGRKDFGSALKLSVYSNTPYCLASVFSLVPALSFLVILGLYGFYLFYVGAPVLMKSKPGSWGYPLAVFAIVFLIALPIGAVQMLFWT